MMTRCFFGLALFTCTVTNTVAAGSTIFSERSEFDAAVDVSNVEGFEAAFENAITVTFPGFSVTEDSPFAAVGSRTDYVSAGERSLGFTWNGDRNLTFTFDPPVDAFAADILDFGTCCGATVLNIESDTGELIATAAVGGNLPRGNLQFFGVTTEAPFSTLTFTSDQNSDNDLIVFDEVAFHAVPEPSGLVHVLVAPIAYLLMRRRFRN